MPDILHLAATREGRNDFTAAPSASSHIPRNSNHLRTYSNILENRAYCSDKTRVFLYPKHSLNKWVTLLLFFIVTEKILCTYKRSVLFCLVFLNAKSTVYVKQEATYYHVLGEAKVRRESLKRVNGSLQTTRAQTDKNWKPLLLGSAYSICWRNTQKILLTVMLTSPPSTNLLLSSSPSLSEAEASFLRN